MKILTVDIGTGTQDIFLYDSNLDLENGFKLVLPSPTMMIHRRLKQALHKRTPILLTGHQMGGGPSAWAIEEYARAGIPVYMTPSAATTINDELEKVGALGIKIVGEEESKKLKVRSKKGGIISLELKDFDFELISRTFKDYGVALDDLSAVAVAVFDHGNAPAGVSDRQFRFDYLDARIRAKNSLSAFAYLSNDVPKIMTRLQSVVDSVGELPCPLVVMDTAPAAVLGATFDSKLNFWNSNIIHNSGKHKNSGLPTRRAMIVCNVGNFHTLAFRLGEKGIEGVFEHHTGEIDLPKLESLIRRLADASLKHEDVFNDMGHGALMYTDEVFEFGKDEFDVVVTGPRRSMFQTVDRGPQTEGHHPRSTVLRPYFAVPFGDMMIAGCFGLLAATAEVMPELAESIFGSLRGGRGRGVAPWDNPS